MVQKKSARRPRGRPRAYDPDKALAGVTAAFWDAGYAGTSLDALTGAAGMNRPSLYGAFGNKHALYMKTLAQYREMGRGAMREALSYELSLADGLRRVYARAIAIYTDGDNGARGCFLIGTAATESVLDPKIRRMFADGLHELDEQLEARFRHALDAGELKSGLGAGDLARIACGIMNSLALRARAGDPRSVLEATAEAGVRLLCGLA
jgi:TetR/AcrR family transcriptional regulator, copper-responsive repressor